MKNRNSRLTETEMKKICELFSAPENQPGLFEARKSDIFSKKNEKSKNYYFSSITDGRQ